MRNKVGRSYW